MDVYLRLIWQRFARQGPFGSPAFADREVHVRSLLDEVRPHDEVDVAQLLDRHCDLFAVVELPTDQVVFARGGKRIPVERGEQERQPFGFRPDALRYHRPLASRIQLLAKSQRTVDGVDRSRPHDMRWHLPSAERVVISDWKDDYNHRRRHSSLGYQPPAVYAAACTHQ